MGDEQKRKPLFWPVLFLGAFATGAVLWCVWMLAIVEKTRRIRPDEFYTPISKPAAPVATNRAEVSTNASSAASNSISAGAK